MSFFNILQVSNEHQITQNDEIYQINFHSSRFLEYTDEDIRILYKTLTQEKLDLLKKYPALVTMERFEKEISLGKILNITYSSEEQNIVVEFNKLHSINIQTREDITYTDEDTKETWKQKNKDFDFYLNTIKEYLKFEGLEEYRNHWALKSGDIFALSANNPHFQIFNNSTYINLFPTYNDPLPLPQYISPSPISSLDVTVVAELETQPQHTIASVSQFIDKINELSTEDELKNRELFFRGHRDALRYFLQPTLFRQYKSKGPIYLKSEKSSFMDLLTTEPKSFSNESRCFDILTHMQHYSFPTRLLDISSNPLAALYFACEIEKDDKGKEKDIDGEVILFYIKKSEIKYFDSDAVSCVTNLAKLTESQKKELIKLIEQCESETPPRKAFKSTDYENNEAYASYIHFIRQEKPYFEPKIKISDLNKVLCVKERLTQDRIIAQAGSFLLFGLDASLPEDGNDVFKIKRIRIKSANKSSILKELDQLKVNLRTIYPSLENTAKYIKSKLELEADSK